MGHKYGSWLTWWTTAVLLLTPGMVQKCGQANEPYQPRMVGGTEPGKAHPASYSAVALVTKANKQPFCSGTIIADQLVVTAAHCIFKRRPEDIQVMFGRDTQDPQSKFVDVIAKETFKKAQKYESNFDIGWLKLAETIPKTHKAIEIWHDPSVLTPGTPLLIAGYGRTSSNCSFSDPSCQGGRLLAVDSELRRFVSGERLYGLLVIGSDAKAGPCFGDSGGPAYMNYDGQWFLIGDFMGWDKILVHEELETICDRGEGVYNYIGDYAKWIETSSGIQLAYQARKNPRPIAQELPVLLEEPSTFAEWCLYSNHEDPAWYTVQRLIRVAAEGVLLDQKGADPSSAFTDCVVAEQTVEAYVRQHQSLRLVGFDPALNIDYARLEDIRPLRSLRSWGLKRLILADHSIVDFSPIEDLVELELLEIVDNNFFETTGPGEMLRRPFQIAAIPGLRELRINNANTSVDFLELNRLTNLEVLDLSYVEFPDLQLLGHLSLRELRLENVELAKTGDLPALTQLESLVLRFVNVTTIPSQMPHLKTLHLWDLPHLKIIQLGQSRDLESLILYGLGLQNLPAISHYGQLKELAIIGNRHLRSIAGLGPLPLLENLEIIDNPLTSLGQIRDLPRLKELVLHQNRLQVLELQDQLPNLENLELTDNDLRELSFLEYTPALRFLNISHNPKVDIAGIAQLDYLERLAMENTKGEGLSSLASLHNLSNLKEINVKNNQLQSLDDLLKFADIEVVLASYNMIQDIQKLGALQKLDYLEVIDNPIAQKNCPIEDRGGFCRFEWLKINFN